ncbi:MAG: AAA family ATPase [Bacteroidetes bacterium]|nr:AAA family ATPase [Bacteroidota bacterium]
MKIIKLDIYGFRGIQEGHIIFSDNAVLFGANCTGKSSIIDALTITCSKTPIHKELSEYDFFNANPKSSERFRIIVTIGGFSNNTPDDNLDWFRDGRAITKWWNKNQKTITINKENDDDLLCCQVGLAGRFDFLDLSVDTIRYFHDDDIQVDPFDEDKIVPFPSRLLDDIGLFVLPTLRLRENIISFNSYIFKNLLNKISNLPSDYIIKERDKFRNPEEPIEEISGIKEVVSRINDSFKELLPLNPELKLKFTQTDAESILRIISPHYSIDSKTALPAKRHGSGLLSLQFLLLLLELGKIKKQNGESFILLIEEPEIHISPNIQNQLIYKSFKDSDQVICSTHSPQIASFFSYTETIFLSNNKGSLFSKPFRNDLLTNDATQAQRKIFIDNRDIFIKSLLYPNLIIPEGRIDYEWLSKLISITESNEAYNLKQPKENSFGTLYGVIPTHNASIVDTYKELSGFNKNIIIIVDGDTQGSAYISDIKAKITSPIIIIQWGDSFTMEDIIAFILKADETAVIKQIKENIDNSINTFEEFLAKLKSENEYKGNYLVHLEIASIIRNNGLCVLRTISFLEKLNKTIMDVLAGPISELDNRSTDQCKIVVWSLQ